MDGDSGSPAGRRRLDATERPPISMDAVYDLLPATSAGATYSVWPFRELIWSTLCSADRLLQSHR
jgi:hypothetical protein